MVDKSRYRSYRPDDPDSHEAATASGVSHGDDDPLAELARLIGQDDILAEPKRVSSPRALRDREYREADQTTRWPPARWFGSDSAGQGQAFDRTAREQEPDDPHQDRQGSHADTRAAYDSHHAQHGRYPSRPEHIGAAGSEDDDRYVAAADGGAQSYDTAVGEHSAYRTATQAVHGYESDAYYADDPDVSPEGEEGYDAQPVTRRRGGLLIIAAVVGVALAGTAGAFGYRAWTSDSGAVSQPPIISADRAPVKLVPEAQSADIQQKKAIYDRVTDKAQAAGERVVSRTEDPVDVTDATRVPRVVFPGPEAGPAASMATVASPLNEPKKVKTQIIRPDNTMDLGGASPAQAPPVAPSAGATAPSPPGPAATGQRRSTQRAPQPAASSSPPDQGDVGPTATARANSYRTASATPAGEAGYMVQVSSQRSEVDASASYRALQAKYPSVLGDRQAVIRRVDLHDKGVFFRAMIGPFATAEEANQLCGSLKAAGGQCLVPKN
jgi:SPOR domain